MISKSTRFYYLIEQSLLTSTFMSCHVFDYKTTKMRFQKTFLLRCVKIGLCGFMSQAIISYIEGLSQNFFSKYLLKRSKLGKPSYFVIWLTLWHHGTQVMSLNLVEQPEIVFYYGFQLKQDYSSLYFEGKTSVGASIVFSGFCRASLKASVNCRNAKVG